jgi:dihydroorotase
MALMLKGAHVVDPQVGLDDNVDLIIDNGKIEKIGKNLDGEACEVVDISGKTLVPGLVDAHVHLREPGFEYKEDIESGTRAAAAGGFTQICAMPNTDPCVDDAVGVEYVSAISRERGKCKVSVSGACTKERQGEILSDMGNMFAHGVRMFTDDGQGVQKAGIMRLVMDYASQFDCVVATHAQDDSLVGDGQVNEGVISTRLGLTSWPAEGEEIIIERDISLCRLTGCPLHVQHVTTKRGLSLIKRAKEEGLPVTCEVTPHHMFFCEDDIDDMYPTNLKVNPPLRTKEDADALIQGVKDGTVDIIVTDHAPHAIYEKDREFELAPFGMCGLETSLGAVLTNLVANNEIDLSRLVELMAVNPRKILRLEPVELREGSIADITIFDDHKKWVAGESGWQSKSGIYGFEGCEFIGKPTDVLVDGEFVFKDEKIVG